MLIGCGGGGDRGVDPDGGTSLVIMSSTPADGQQNVAVDSIVLVTFSRDLDPDSVNQQSIRVGEIGGSGEVSGQAVLDGTNPRMVRWTPSGLMQGATPHACELSGGIRSVDGRFLQGDLTFAFRTGADLPGPALPGRSDLLTLSSTLNVGRRSHTATLLSSGQVLLAGGFKQGSLITDRAELFTGLGFSLIGAQLVQGRASHTATRLNDGRVLLTGGWYEASLAQLATTEWAEVYDPSARTFTRVGDMTTERVDHAALLLPDGRVLITGGSRLEGTFLRDLDTAEIFDPATGTFSAHSEPMIHTRATHAMEDLGTGKFVLYGGSDADQRPSLFDTATELFSPLLPAAQDGERWGAVSATFASGAACVAGGDRLSTVIYVEPTTGYAQNTGSGLNFPRAYGTATRYGPDRILVVGGYDFDTAIISPTCDVVIEGGVGGSRTYGCDMRFASGMVWHTATRLDDGRVLFCGGLNEVGGAPELDTAYLFTPPEG